MTSVTTNAKLFDNVVGTCSDVGVSGDDPSTSVRFYNFVPNRLGKAVFSDVADWPHISDVVVNVLEGTYQTVGADGNTVFNQSSDLDPEKLSPTFVSEFFATEEEDDDF